MASKIIEIIVYKNNYKKNNDLTLSEARTN